jgi:UPF0716 family protein affecting phage T7 exclusion
MLTSRLRLLNLGLGKRGIVWQEIGRWLIAVVLLTIIIIGLILLKYKGINLIDKLIEFFRYQR